MRIRLALGLLVLLAVGCEDRAVSSVEADRLKWENDVAKVVDRPPWPTKNAVELKPGTLPTARLDAEIVSALKKQALAGDAKSAWSLRQYFAHNTPKDGAEVSKWEKIAAENGDSSGASYLAFELEEAGGEENCLRARFWHDKAGRTLAEEHHKTGETALVNLMALAENWEACVNRGSLIKDATEGAQPTKQE